MILFESSGILDDEHILVEPAVNGQAHGIVPVCDRVHDCFVDNLRRVLWFFNEATIGLAPLVCFEER